MIKVLPDKFSTLGAAAEAAKLTSTLTAPEFDETVFIPTNDVSTMRWCSSQPGRSCSLLSICLKDV